MTASPDQLIANLRARAHQLRADAAAASAAATAMSFTARSAHVTVRAGADGALQSIAFTDDLATLSAPGLSREVLDIDRAVESAVTDPQVMASGRVGAVTLTTPADEDTPGVCLPGRVSALGPRPVPDVAQVRMVAELARTGTGPLHAVMDPALRRGDYEQIARTRTEQKLTRLAAVQDAASRLTGQAANDLVALEIGDRGRLTSVRFTTAALRATPEALAQSFAAAHTAAIADHDDQVRALWNQEH